MSNKTEFEDWESQPGFDVVHVFVVDRGDLSAAKRLTLTDKKFTDTAYSATYPAPINCITSDITTNEQVIGGTSFGDITLANVNGQFDDILSGDNILKRPFAIYRGSFNWSLASTVYPNKFIPVIIGEVAQVRFGKGTVTLKIRPRTYQLETIVGGFSSLAATGSAEPPVVIGKCFNVKAVLVDSAANSYRCNSVVCDNVYQSVGLDVRFAVRDQGVLLDYPFFGAGSPDYNITNESDGEFRGQFTLTGGAPAGQLTCDVNWHGTATAVDARLDPNIRWLLANYATEDYPTQDNEITISVTIPTKKNQCWGKNDERYYQQKTNGDFNQFNLSTAGDISTISDSGNSITLGGSRLDGSSRFNIAGDRLWVCNDGATIIEWSLTTAWELNTATVTGNQLAITTEFPSQVPVASYLADILIFDDGAGNYVLYLMTIFGKIYETAGFTTSVNAAKTSVSLLHELRDFAGDSPQQSVWAKFDVNTDWSKIYVLATNPKAVYQFDLITIGALADLFDVHRVFNIPENNTVEVFTEYYGFHMGVDGDQFYLNRTNIVTLTDDYIGEHSGITNSDLPVSLFAHNQKGGLINMNAGAAFSGATPLGTILKELLKNWDSSFVINRHGELHAVQLKDPEATQAAWETLYSVDIGDFVGAKGEHIIHAKTERAKSKFTVHFAKNYTVQSEADLQGIGVDQDDVDLYSTPHQVTTTTAAPSGYIDAEEVVLSANIGSEAEAIVVRDNLKTLRQVDRNHYQFKLNLQCISFLSDFGLGSILAVSGDVIHPDFADGDQAQVIGRRVNWTKNNQTLRVFK